jgi:hypothetical protein
VKKYTTEDIKAQKEMLAGLPSGGKEIYLFLLLNSVLANLEKLNEVEVVESELAVTLEDLTMEALKKKAEEKGIDTKNLKKEELIEKLLG